MFDYKKLLTSENFEDMYIEVTQADKIVSLVGNEKGLLYLASRIISYVNENNPNTDFNDIKFDRGVDLTDKSLYLSILLAEKEDV